MKELNPSSPVSAISGVGPTRERQLQRLGLYTVRDLVFNFPRMYEERGNVLPLAYADTESSYGFLLTVASEVRNASIRKGLTISKFRAFDETGVCEVTFFNAPFVKDTFHTGSQFRFWGRLTQSKRTLQLTNPKYEPYVEGIELAQFVPIYPQTQGINSKFIEKITKAALDAYLPSSVDYLPEEIRLKNGLATLNYALKNIHFPTDAESLSRAMRRLAFDEMLMFGLGISMATRHKSATEGVRFSPCDLSPLLNLIPYELTKGQKNAVNDVWRDTVIGTNGSVKPMARIIVGDVGSGKTVCATIAMYIAATSKYQAALLAPTEILARQHYNELSALYSKLGIKAELLLGSTTAKEKRRIYADIESGECDIVIGTHALLSDKISFANLGLIITDEQHRFGVNQRAYLKDKAKRAHMLVMSATPIPRTLALTMYGDLDVSRITEMPSGRQRVDTFVVDEGYRDRLCDFIKKQVALGGQCYVVCPAIERGEETLECTLEPVSLTELSSTKSKDLNLKNAIEHTENLRQKLYGIRVECLHGKMKAKEKDAVMSAFASGEISVLVSTTVVEVGVNVPNATLMVIENAERFGLSQLHQLRGRVGRGKKKSYCVLVSGGGGDTAASRLEVMRTTYDGFEIAERDLLLRGPGDFFTSSDTESLRQSGGFSFKLASLCNDSELFNTAFATAKEITNADPTLSLSENLGLREELNKYILHDNSTIS